MDKKRKYLLAEPESKNDVDLSVLHRYPFKAMIPIIRTLTSYDESINIYKIQKASQSCIPDTTEVTEMLSFLTSYGCVLETPEGWIRIKEIEKKPEKPRRFYFLKDIFAIIMELSSEIPLESSQIAKNVKLDENLVLKYLNFISMITKVGCVKIVNNQYPNSYFIAQYI